LIKASAISAKVATNAAIDPWSPEELSDWLRSIAAKHPALVIPVRRLGSSRRTSWAGQTRESDAEGHRTRSREDTMVFDAAADRQRSQIRRSPVHHGGRLRLTLRRQAHID
jgi:hypothetical protein